MKQRFKISNHITDRKKALIWLCDKMEIGRAYKVTEKQSGVLIDIFTSHMTLPTVPTKGYNYYFDISANFKTIRKNPIK